MSQNANQNMERRRRKRDRIRDLVLAGMRGLVPRGRARSVRYVDDDEVSPDSDLGRPGRTFHVVTTAALPWMTGTAVNPLLRAAYLARGRPAGDVTLVVPWLAEEADRRTLYAGYRFDAPADQEAHVREWLREKAGMPAEAASLNILWYGARYHPVHMSIFSVCDICSLIPEDGADVCVLEEPEHLNWFRRKGNYKRFRFTVGIVHTNYRAYAGAQSGGFVRAPIIAGASLLVVRAYCDRVIKLSPVLQKFSPEKEVVCNVHGVREEFVAEGRRRAGATEEDGGDVAPVEGTRAYFVGKMLWTKGLDKMMHLQHFYRKVTGKYFDLDVIGDGPDLEEIKRAYLGRSTNKKEEEAQAKELAEGTKHPNLFDGFDLPKTIRELVCKAPIPTRFLGRKDHFEATAGDKYTVFINPSVTEVLCTTTAEALAMGKFAVIPAHPSNSFFAEFPNCLPYASDVEFAAALGWALGHDPEPLSEELARAFTWEAATERFVVSAAVTVRQERARARARARAGGR
eukprot:CAMPEP_0194274728 /NCGR_PEP_ID=MMETSP0169-20130528/7741_1 /TAXON_ID=218684 /ORGANISM="Corethron pennatum, Strain L29A3" /LENGTH=513 /DNA_ID=CAMNT_0039018003 /DNA_START=1 /DNA_END=1539 /DNA_ORIENTATION=+